MAQLVKNPPAMQETWVPSLGWDDTLERGMATRSSILAWRIPWTAHRVAKSRTRLSVYHFHLGSPLTLFWLEVEKCFVEGTECLEDR